jgi:hypothetical protein
MCTPGVTRHTSIRYSSSWHTRVKFGAAIISLHTLESPSGRNVNYDEKQLHGKTFSSCSFYLYRFRKYVSYGFPIINFCNTGLRYETSYMYACMYVYIYIYTYIIFSRSMKACSCSEVPWTHNCILNETYLFFFQIFSYKIAFSSNRKWIRMVSYLSFPFLNTIFCFCDKQNWIAAWHTERETWGLV